MTAVEFQGFPKIPRLYRDAVVTEKIDGTNGAVGILKFQFGWHVGGFDPADGSDHSQPDSTRMVFHPDDKDETGMPNFEYLVYAQSRNRILSLKEDNHGFARYVYDNAYSLVDDLGPGLHFGEWWGKGVGRNYGLDHNRFSLFNVKRWEDEAFKTPGLEVVPVVERGEFATLMVKVALHRLRVGGSFAAPGFMNPEGAVVFHNAGNVLFKATLEGDAVPKLSVIQQLRRDLRQDMELAA
jgi:RNA ligase-like protein